MYIHKPKDTDKHEHSIKHLVYILTVTRWAATTTLRRKPRQPEGPGRQPICYPRWRTGYDTAWPHAH
ncbi:hypothetical protein GW17_00061385 [Ensete ventricosum]|nr:hypothetical protein GW17_00061385 [Ensete ventricosum]